LGRGADELEVDVPELEAPDDGVDGVVGVPLLPSAGSVAAFGDPGVVVLPPPLGDDAVGPSDAPAPPVFELDADDDPASEPVVSACASPAVAIMAAPNPRVTAPALNQFDTGKTRWSPRSRRCLLDVPLRCFPAMGVPLESNFCGPTRTSEVAHQDVVFAEKTSSGRT
jgi:hypothetical protein